MTRSRPGLRKARTRFALAWGVAVPAMLSAFGCEKERVVIGVLPGPELSGLPGNESSLTMGNFLRPSAPRGATRLRNHADVPP
ncbi:MAG: hypothetical protein H0W86_11775 [Armatimonadetes bacterium]|nr:hypothetical protein [Armatimonadota bacterium]